MFKFTVAVAAGALLAAQAQAGNSQGTVSQPGGFTSACAASITSGTTYTPGLDLVAQFKVAGGNARCDTAAFSGAAASSQAATQWVVAPVDNHSSAQGRMGVVGLQSSMVGRNNAPFPAAVSAGGWSERMVVDLAGHTGQSATWLFTVDVTGTLNSAPGGSTGLLVNAYRNGLELANNIAGSDRGASDAIGTDRQRYGWRARQGADRVIQDQVTFAVPVTLGQSFVWGVYATAAAGLSSSATGVTRLTDAQADFSDGIRYGGSAGVLIGGVLYSGESLSAGSGIDWTAAAPVPEPATAALLLAGLLFVARRAADECRSSSRR